MRRPLAYLLAWLVATAVAVGGAWVGLQPLLAAAAAERPPSLSATYLRDMARTPTATPAPEAADVCPSATPSAPASATPSAAATSSPTAAATADPSPTGGPPSPSPTDEWEEVAGGAFRRTFVVEGGEALFEVSPDRVELVSHTANPGFDATVNRWARHSMVVSFDSRGHASRVWVQWRNGPYAEITESA